MSYNATRTIFCFATDRFRLFIHGIDNLEALSPRHGSGVTHWPPSHGPE
uniref:Uncharacterized protein n=1 Tax=Anguilla anguilla TaxID=7936 RepID=A0A0E9QIQ1_ANGAN